MIFLRSSSSGLLALLFAFALPARAVDWKVATVASSHKLTATAPGVLEPYPAQPIELQMARDEWECFQIVVTAGTAALEGVAVRTIGTATVPQPADQLRFYWENYVLIDHPSGNWRLDTLWYPDALVPLAMRPMQRVEAGRSVVVWGELHVPTGTKAGQYALELEVAAGGDTVRVPVKVRVHPVDCPAPTMQANVGLYYDVVRDWYAKNAAPLDDAQFATLKKNYYDFLLQYRLNAYDPPVAWDHPAIDGYLRDPRVRGMRVTSVDSTNLPMILDTFRRNKVLDKAYYYWIDEPPPERYAEVRATTEKIRKFEPKLPHCVTVFPNETLKGAVDIWCPNIGDFFGLGNFDAKALHAAGGRAWWYTMVEPKNPYPTWLVDDNGSAVRVYGWLMAKYGIEGFVYSMVHGWGPKPFENIQSFAGTNGDGTLIYPAAVIEPGNLGALPSIRLMQLRDAIEDYELLHRSDVMRKNIKALKIDHGPFLNGSASVDWQLWKVTVLDWRLLFFASIDPLPEAEKLRPTLRIGNVDDVIPQLSAATIDGDIREKVWKAEALLGALTMSGYQVNEDLPDTTVWVGYHAGKLQIAFECEATNTDRRGEWVAVDLAPADGSVRWRLLVTAGGKPVVEKHSREGQFRIEGLNWKAAVKPDTAYYYVEMEIPLDELDLDVEKFRLNVLRRLKDGTRDVRFTVRASPDAGDASRMPLVRLAKPGG